MKSKRIMAEQSNGTEALYNSYKDRWSRRAKHQLAKAERTTVKSNWECGDLALYEGTHVEVIVPNGPNKTIGILWNGSTKMVAERKLVKLDENVVGGLLSVNPINRMMQLAGISVPMTIGETADSEENKDELMEADATNMFEALMKANLAGEFKNNPDAARLATVGQVMVGLENVIQPLREKVTPDLVSKLDAAVGLGAALLQTAQRMLKPE